MAWEPMETAPKDRQILVRRHNDVAYEYFVVWWGDHHLLTRYPWTSDYTAYPTERLDDWHEIPA